ncbi:hypothetical protein KIN20_029410 [Parelaphostrongylus tenuis]|uniref:Uncharacterized protein n=1 Tax=Parelaphostrongylus tenuis TaxID=148309 RepID=A0AAD5R2K5_PARTN|nr:hypothetical protein KIN20_029410 [Parelaphostrongylus tenuis]
MAKELEDQLVTGVTLTYPKYQALYRHRVFSVCCDGLHKKPRKICMDPGIASGREGARAVMQRLAM